ncbi:hypothetical protein RRG08_028838 [Elysia crispata]|uniref:Uncharacterized protein n=1 Tax=Elysia crispata TaxID=231223 RepID=A0AAE0Z0H1_9GAST|nr:hypothetical protein RRG08_028838 [Elysia crispata]
MRHNNVAVPSQAKHRSGVGAAVKRIQACIQVNQSLLWSELQARLLSGQHITDTVQQYLLDFAVVAQQDLDLLQSCRRLVVCCYVELNNFLICKKHRKPLGQNGVLGPREAPVPSGRTGK